MNESHSTEKSRKALPAFAAEVLRISATVRPQVAKNNEDTSMKNLIFSLRQICRHNRDGSHKTQADRERMLILIGKQLLEMGYRLETAGSLATRHIEALVSRWTKEELNPGSIKNRMSALRWLACKINKASIVARANDAYGIADRQLVTNEDKGRTLTEGEIEAITDPFTQMSLRLQAAFGLRREESIKFQPDWADRGDRLVLKASWTKGGRLREIPIRTETQRALVDEAKALAKSTPRGSLIARETYVAQLQCFKYQCDKAGIHHVHGHRHRYAQHRYWELTGRACPSAGGPTSRRLVGDAKAIDRVARLTISAELGHSREQVTAVYLGR
jgi:site-specific recombinase XerC